MLDVYLVFKGMAKSIFLHYGPGGNAHVERKLLGDSLPECVFWDQPKTQGVENQYLNLVDLTSEKIKEVYDISTIIGHSFGCDLTKSILYKNEPVNLKRLILISPLRDIPMAFFNLGKHLNGLANSDALLAELKNFSDHSKNISMRFWGIVSHIATHAKYAESFWYDRASMLKYADLCVDAPVFDLTEWQSVINSYVFGNQFESFDIFKKYKTTVVFGKQDPYLTDDDIVYWTDLVGLQNVVVLDECGHFPQVEKTNHLLKLI